jgi:hypothetical protein
LANGNYSANGNVTIGNVSLVANGTNQMRFSRCCYPIMITSANGTRVGISRCLPIAQPMGSNGIENSSSWNSWNITQVNVSVIGRNKGNFNARCEFQNGALSCSSANQSVRPQDIIRGIRQSMGSQGGFGLGGNPFGSGTNMNNASVSGNN